MGRLRPASASIILVLCGVGCTDRPNTSPEEQLATATAAEQTPDDVLILGDSVSMGYYPYVAQYLDDSASVYRPPGNHKSTWDALHHLDAWLGERSWKVIHFNFGLHDVLRSTLEQYRANLTRIVERLKETDAKLVFATSTPVLPGTPGFVGGDSVAYNDVARTVMERHSVAIDDLHSVAKMHPEDQIPGDLHFTDRGYERLGYQVSRAISLAQHGPHLRSTDEGCVDDRIEYLGVWSLERFGGVRGRPRMVSSDPDARISFSFVGNGFTIFREHSRRGGAMRVCVDDDCRTVDNHFARDFGPQPYGVQGLQRGAHRVRISNVSGGFIDLADVRIHDERHTLNLHPGRHSDDHRSIQYFGSWIRQARSESPAPEGGLVTTSLDPNAGARIPFRGTGLVVYRGIYDDRLEISLCIVGGQCVRDSGFSDALFWGQPLVLAGLPLGTYEAELRMLSGRAFDIESVEIVGDVRPLRSGRHSALREGIHYFGHWNTTELELSDGATRTIQQSRSPKATVYFPFEGDSVGLRVIEASDRGSIELCIDGRCRVFLTQRSGGEPSLVWKRASGFGEGLHHAQLRKVDGRYLDLAEVELMNAH